MQPGSRGCEADPKAWQRFPDRLHDSATDRGIRDEPTNNTPSTPGCSQIASLTTLSPWTRLSTPGGNPHRSISSTSAVPPVGTRAGRAATRERATRLERGLGWRIRRDRSRRPSTTEPGPASRRYPDSRHSIIPVRRRQPTGRRHGFPAGELSFRCSSSFSLSCSRGESL